MHTQADWDKRLNLSVAEDSSCRLHQVTSHTCIIIVK